MGGNDVTTTIGHYQRKIERHQNEPEVLKHALAKLRKLKGVSIAVLQETGVGRVVNMLKKSPDEEVATMAKDLVALWKQIVANEEEENEQVTEQDNEMHEPQEEHEEYADVDHPEAVEESDDVEEEPPRKKERTSENGHRHHHSSRSSSHKSKKSKSSKHERDERDEHGRHESSSKKSKKHKRDRDERPSGSKSDHNSNQSKSRHESKSSNHNGHRSNSPKPSSSVKPSTSSHYEPSSMLALPDGISPNYKPLPPKPNPRSNGGQRFASSTDEALSALLAMSKGKAGRRTAVYSGTKRSGYVGEVPSLFQLCIYVLQEHVDAIEECGNLSYDVLKPVLERASPETLMNIEEYNPHLMEDTGELWERFCKKKFPKEQREEMESWREMFERCTEAQAQKLDRLKMKVKSSYDKEKNETKKAKLAYVGLNAKPPRQVMRAQAKNGTGLGIGTPATKARPGMATLGGPSGPSGPPKRPKVAPIMAKTLKMVRGMKNGFRR